MLVDTIFILHFSLSYIPYPPISIHQKTCLLQAKGLPCCTLNTVHRPLLCSQHRPLLCCFVSGRLLPETSVYCPLYFIKSLFRCHLLNEFFLDHLKWLFSFPYALYSLSLICFSLKYLSISNLPCNSFLIFLLALFLHKECCFYEAGIFARHTVDAQ